MNELLNRLTKNTTIKETDVLSESKVYNKKDCISTPIPMINVALSGRLDGGLMPGLTGLAGPSRHFKSLFAFIMAGAYLHKYDDAVLLFYDSEFGTPKEYFETLGIDQKRIVHTPITNLEELRHDLSNQLESINRGDHVIIVIDSLGNLASKKEVNDAISGNEAADMTRAKVTKSLWRIVTPHLRLKDIPCIAVMHVYDTMEMFSKQVVSGGTGNMLSSDNLWIIGRQQDKDGKDLEGYNFIINIEKSRYVKEKSKIPINVNFEKGISRWSGMFDLAVELGYLQSPNKGWYCDTRDPEKRFRKAEVEDSGAFWKDILKNTDFAEAVKNKFSLASGSMLQDEEEETDTHA